MLTEYEKYKEGGLAVAFSGGVDSTFLLAIAAEELGADKVLALTMKAPIIPEDELEYAADFCRKLGVRHKIIDGSDVLETDAFAENPPDRCYHCKHHIFSKLLSEAEGLPLADGTNLDDLGDYRPGMKALSELGIVSPLKDAGFTKADIRAGLKERGIEIWDKPACACLASRVPYGQAVTAEKVLQIYKLESRLHELGFSQVRVRHHGDVARIEVLPEERKMFFDEQLMDEVNKFAVGLGFKYCSLDLGGYVMGSLNKDVVEKENKNL